MIEDVIDLILTVVVIIFIFVGLPRVVTLINDYLDKKEGKMVLKDLAGRHKLSGVDYVCGTSFEGASVKFCLDGVTYVAKENPDDGYRSYMEDLEITDTPCRNVFPEQDVFCDYESAEAGGFGWRHIPADILAIKNLQTAKVILRIGTVNIGDYYPECVMEYYPENLPCNSMKEDQS